MKHITLFGAGKSATVLIEYLIRQAQHQQWQISIVDQNEDLVRSKIGQSKFAKAVSLDIKQEKQRKELISSSDLIISLLPPTLHYIVAEDCLEFGKHLLTASYVDAKILNLRAEVAQKNVLFLCEMGLDPGIDHMSAMQIVHRIKKEGGKVTSFKSHCGGLVAPESDDNPWHYKISWNPRNIVLAGKDGAVYREHGATRKLGYDDLFREKRLIEIGEDSVLSWYPNRDSMNYVPIYELDEADTFVRTTLRHPDFIYGWKNIIELKLTDTTPEYTFEEEISLASFFKLHFEKNGFSDWVKEKMINRFSQTKDMLEKLMKLMEVEEEAEKQGQEFPDQVMMVDEKGKLNDIHVEEVKENAAAVVAMQMHEANLTLKQLFFLGMDDKSTMIPKGTYSAADIMQIALEKKLALKSDEKDMVVMVHEIEYETGGQKRSVVSSMIVKGENNLHTAMAKTVGLPLGIAARLILNGTIRLTGLHIPIVPEIYEPILDELRKEGIVFNEREK